MVFTLATLSVFRGFIQKAIGLAWRVPRRRNEPVCATLEKLPGHIASESLSAIQRVVGTFFKHFSAVFTNHSTSQVKTAAIDSGQYGHGSSATSLQRGQRRPLRQDRAMRRWIVEKCYTPPSGFVVSADFQRQGADRKSVV